MGLAPRNVAALAAAGRGTVPANACSDGSLLRRYRGRGVAEVRGDLHDDRRASVPGAGTEPACEEALLQRVRSAPRNMAQPLVSRVDVLAEAHRIGDRYASATS